MIKAKFLFFIIFFNILSNITWSQTDSLEIDELSKTIWYLGFGGGPICRGGSVDCSFTFASSDYWGASCNLRAGLLKSDNVPTDYYDDGLRIFSPKDYYSFLSFNLLKKFSTSDRSLRFGFETGPSLVRYSLAEFELNPEYSIYQGSWFPEHKYIKTHTVQNTIGLSLEVKAEFPVTSFFGFELAFFTVINELQSVWGLDICINFGKLTR